MVRCRAPQDSGPRAFDLKDFYTLKPPRDRFYADPFVVERGRRSYLFFEELIFAKRKGVISCIEFNEQGFLGGRLWYWKPPTISPTLSSSIGRARPICFRRAADSGRIELFRAVEFPYRWEFAGSLMENVWAVDATIFEHEGQFWMFAAGITRYGKINSESVSLLRRLSARAMASSCCQSCCRRCFAG